MLRFAVSVFICFSTIASILNSVALSEPITCSGIVPMKNRNDKVSIKDFGGVGDGKTLNTKAFQKAIDQIRKTKKTGGTVLYIPPGVYLSETFNLTSHMTLYLAKGAVIKATQDSENWPLTAPLPSYGRGRELPGGRYQSFIHADGVEDVIITGDNGTFEGQGAKWWDMYKQKTLKFTRPSLIEFMNSKDILISNLVFQNSPFWNIHPVYSSNVVVRNVTILAPYDSPNTDGVDADSSSHVCIEDSFMSIGDDLVAVKSGWDQYGIAFGRPSSDITIRRITGTTQFAGIAIGSETSGGIENVYAEQLNLYNIGLAVHVKSNVGRGAFIRNITITDVFIDGTVMAIQYGGNSGGHPDDNYDRKALPVVKGITVKNVVGVKVEQAGDLVGLEGAPYAGLCFSNISLYSSKQNGPTSTPWTCSNVTGGSHLVKPGLCGALTSSC